MGKASFIVRLGALSPEKVLELKENRPISRIKSWGLWIQSIVGICTIQIRTYIKHGQRIHLISKQGLDAKPLREGVYLTNQSEVERTTGLVGECGTAHKTAIKLLICGSVLHHSIREVWAYFETTKRTEEKPCPTTKLASGFRSVGSADTIAIIKAKVKAKVFTKIAPTPHINPTQILKYLPSKDLFTKGVNVKTKIGLPFHLSI